MHRDHLRSYVDGSIKSYRQTPAFYSDKDTHQEMLSIPFWPRLYMENIQLELLIYGFIYCCLINSMLHSVEQDDYMLNWEG
jgi:hypothetical protein